LTVSPFEEYISRRAARAHELARLTRLDLRISQSRLITVAAAVLCVVLLARDVWPAGPLAIPIAVFVALAVWHDRVLRASARVTRAIEFYDHGLARLEDRWQSLGQTGHRFLDERHLYAGDLDIFGPASLFQLLSRVRTNLGEELLAAWLTTPARLHTIRLRQQAVDELRGALDFREALATAGGESQVNTRALNTWASSPPAAEGILLRSVAVVLAVGIVGATVWWVRGGPVAPLFVFIALKMILTRPSRKRVAAVIRGVEIPFRQLDVLADTLEFIEQATFTTARAQQIRTGMMSHGILPSRAIGRLKRLVDMLDWRRNAFFAPISAALSWPLHLAAAIEGWRREFGPKVSAWLDAVAEYEVLSSLAAYSYEHPADPFPDFVEDQTARLEGLQLGHPLVPTARMVRNDVHLTPEVSVLIVSGSNMSGKSTLLRTVGVNVVLAMAGAPVRAQQLQLTPLAVGATLHVHDSLQAGRSRFFAEIERIRAITDLTDRLPKPIFLLDELLQGTNSHDRAIGAEALLRALIERGAIGLITTHDLALAAIADRSRGRAANVHFEDELRGGELVFDYKMRPGPVTHSNALALMKAVGLPVR
jgi:hypothetical protein